MFIIPSLIGAKTPSSGSNLLLDNYPNSAAAYSLRQLSSTYSGDAIRVRRASDNTETNIGFVNNKLDTATLSTFCSGTNGFVTTWYDQSGNGYDATQTTASNQPKIYDSVSGIIEENGKPSVQFDGTDDELIASAISTISLESIFIANTPSSNVKGLLGGPTVIPYIAISSVDARYRTTSSSSLQPLTSNANISLNSFNSSGGQVYAYRNSVVSTVVLNISTIIGIDRIGRRSGSSAYNGNVCECILYDFDQATNRANIESNIINFYSL